MEIGVDTSEVNVGMAYLQNAPATALVGPYAISAQGIGVLSSGDSPWSAVGAVSVASNNFTGFTDYNVGGVTPASNVSLTGSISSTATPPLSLTGLNAASATTANGYFYFPIDATRVLAIEGDGTQLGLLQLEGLNP
jgi:hypothetical protein